MEMKEFGTIAMLILLLAAGCTQTASRQDSFPAYESHIFSYPGDTNDCYYLGYRYARYATLLSLFGPEGPANRYPDDRHLVIPVECRNSEFTRKGMQAAVENIYKLYGIPLEGVE